MDTGTAVVVGVVVIASIGILAFVVTSPPQMMNTNTSGSTASNTTSDVASGITSGLFAGIGRLIRDSNSASPGSGNASGTRNPNQRGLDTMNAIGSWEGVGNTPSGYYLGPSASGRT
jgi:hypothetical protein